MRWKQLRFYVLRGFLPSHTSVPFLHLLLRSTDESGLSGTQTSPSSTFPTTFGAALAEMSKTKAETQYPFGSLVPLWSRQIPYTMAKFFHTRVPTEPKESYAKTT
ncbi:hypothetical protein EDD22DRAFT_1004367 [Suillus occidentalis]|nr:hypothetical protein EDD22DRAFT_1004367 [Suillus occidentalis]